MSLKYTSNSSKGYTLEVYLEYSKKFWELHNDYPQWFKREQLSNYQMMIADHYNIPIDNVKKLVPNVFDKEKWELTTNIWTKTQRNTVKYYEQLQL